MSSINNQRTPDMNRGVELLLRRRTPEKKTFSFVFQKMVSFLKKDITIYFNISLDIKRQK